MRIGRISFGAAAAVILTMSAALNGATASDTIDVIMLPHSHDDVGWMKTIDQYYHDQVRHIYDTVVEALSSDSTKRFQSVEMAFFWKWVQDKLSQGQTDLLGKARDVIASRQLTFVVGGWTMPDESDIHFEAAINGMTVGHEFILDNFGEQALPNYSFEVDPFGATRWMAEMFAEIGFAAHIISRVDYEQKADWQRDRQLEFVWDTSSTVSRDRSSVFTHLMDQYSYCNPGQFNFDGVPPDPPVTDANLVNLAKFLVDNIKERAAWFQSPTLLWPYGCDFQWTNATTMFANMDKVLAYINERKDSYGVSIRYGHLSDYFGAIAAANLTYHRYDRDFEPYDDSKLSYWTGYYTSRPVLKGVIRNRAPYLKAAEQLHVLSSAAGEAVTGAEGMITALRRAQGDGTHHDAVSGTSTTPVCDMYEDLFRQGAETVAPVAVSGMARLTGAARGTDGGLSTSPSSLGNITVGQTVPVVLYNPLGWDYQRVVRFAVPKGSSKATALIVRDAGSGTPLTCQVNPSAGAGFGFGDTAADGDAAAPDDLFVLVSLRALGHVSLTVESVANLGPSPPPGACAVGRASQGPSTISGTGVSVAFGPDGRTSSVTTLRDNRTQALSQDVMEYDSWTNPVTGQTDGAYVFSPAGPAKSVSGGAVDVEIVAGPLVSEARQRFGAGYTQRVRVYSDAAGTSRGQVDSFVETLTSIGPLDDGRDVVTRFSTGVAAERSFGADSNGVMMLERAINGSVPRPIAGNYFPMVTTAFADDGDARVTVFGDRAHGATLISKGALEVMMHRRTITSDGKGPVLDDSKRASDIPLWVRSSPSPSKDPDSWLFRRLPMLLNNPPVAVFGSGSGFPSSPVGSSTALAAPLPANVHLVTLESRFSSNVSSVAARAASAHFSRAENGDGFPATGSPYVTVRLMHAYGPGEHPELSAPVKVDISSIFAFAGVASVEERTLTGVWPIERYAQRHGSWETDGQYQKRYGGFESGPDFPEPGPTAPIQGTVVVLEPLQIRTFLVRLSTGTAGKHSAPSSVKSVHVRSKISTR